MAIFLFCLVVVGIIFIGCYGAWYYGNKRKVNPKMQAHLDKQDNKYKIIELVYKEASKRKDLIVGSHTLKILVLEKLNISPDTMRDCIKELIKEKLIIESEDAIALTTFGVQYYEVYIRQTKKRKKV